MNVRFKCMASALTNDWWSSGMCWRGMEDSLQVPFRRFTLNIIEQSTSSSIDKKRSTCAMNTMQSNLKSHSILTSSFSFCPPHFQFSCRAHLVCVCCGQMLSCWTFVVVQIQYSFFFSILCYHFRWFLSWFEYGRIYACIYGIRAFVICVSLFKSSCRLVLHSFLYYCLSFWNYNEN